MKAFGNKSAVIVFVFVCLTVFVAGCRQAPKPVALGDPGTILEKELLYVGTSDGRPVLLDPAGENKLYALSAEHGQVFQHVELFAVVSMIRNPSDQALMLSTKVPPAARNVPVVAAANHAEAAKLYPPALLDRFQFSSYLDEYTIETYAVKSAKVTSSGPCTVTVEFVADLKPAQNAFSQTRSRWGDPDPDGYVRDRRLVLTLYSYGGRYCAYHSGWMDGIFTDGAPPVAHQPAETMYKPVAYDNIWQALDEGKDVEQVIWEDDTYSFISRVKLRGTAGKQYYEMAVQRVRRSNGSRLTLLEGLRDSWQARPLGLHGRTLYLQAVEALPFSEAYSGPVGSLNLETGEWSVLLAEQTAVLGRVGDKVYVAKLDGSDDSQAAGIYALDTATPELKLVSDLPGPSFNTAYEYGRLMYSMSGKLYIYWPDFETGHGQYALYSVDPASSAIARVD